MTKEEELQSQSLDEILANASLTPLFQPIVSLKHNKIYGYEALIRGPSDSPLHSPLNLFDAASRSGRLAELDLLCREVAIKRFGQLNLTEKLFINTIPEVLLHQDYQHGLTLNFIKQAGIPADQIVIELTEQYPIDDYKLMCDATDHYREMGFKIALDDLGSGYSGLRTWSEIKPDFVKLDRHFIQDIHQDQHKRRFVQSMVDLAKSINCQVIGEGVEVREEYLTTLEMNIEFSQGYYFGRPAFQPQHSVAEDKFCQRKKSSRYKTSIPRANTLVSSLLTPLTPVKIVQNVLQVGERFQNSPQLLALPVIDNNNLIAGMVWRDEIMNLYASRYGRELHGRKLIHFFMDRNPIVAEKDLPLESLSKTITSQATSLVHSSFIITDNNHYCGIGNLIDLLKQITDLQISMARHANPLTGLPGNVPISETTREAVQQQLDVVMCYFDLDNFKPYNDTYGFAKGDQVLQLTAELLITHSDLQLDFIGHVGGDDFVILFSSTNWQQRCNDIVLALTAAHASLYNKQHFEQQGISALDRHGEQVFYPLLSLSIGAVRLLDFTEIKTESDVADYASKAKSLAKKQSNNSIYQLTRNDINLTQPYAAA